MFIGEKKYDNLSKLSSWDPHPRISYKYDKIAEEMDNCFSGTELDAFCDAKRKELFEFYSKTQIWEVPYQNAAACKDAMLVRYVKWNPNRSEFSFCRNAAGNLELYSIPFKLSGVTDGKLFTLRWMDWIYQVGDKGWMTPEPMVMVMYLADDIAYALYDTSMQSLLYHSGKRLVKKPVK